jgi:peptide deformylase
MAILPLVKAPDPRLKKKSFPVNKITNDIQTLLDDMVETMYVNNGVGLAANQVGVLKRLFVMDVSNSENNSTVYKIINPEILAVSEETIKIDEGCLSAPGCWGKILRPEGVKIRFLNEKNKTCELEANGILAQCIQHEIDHINGLLYIDRLSSLRRNIILRKLLKDKRLADKTSALNK